MPINVRTGGVWKTTDRVYTWRNGKWIRAYAVYEWATVGGVTKWWPMFDYKDKIAAAPTGLRGISASHTSATIGWNQTTDPTITGYRVKFWTGSTTVYSPPLGNAPHPVTTTSEVWQPLAADTTYGWTIRSYDEFGKEGPESAPIYLSTGHSQIITTNPSWPNGDHVYITPTATLTYLYGANRWSSGYPWGTVQQGIPDSANVLKCHGCVSYSAAWQVYLNNVANWGAAPPRNVVAIDDALMVRIYRYKINRDNGTKRLQVAPANMNFVNEPTRYGGLSANHAPTFFDSPTPNAERRAFNFGNAAALHAWMLVWLGISGSGYGYNGFLVRDDNTDGTKDADGWNYVNLAAGGDSELLDRQVCDSILLRLPRLPSTGMELTWRH